MSDSCNPTDCNLPGSCVQGIPRQEYWSGLPFPSPGDLPDSGVEPKSPEWVGRFFITGPPGKPRYHPRYEAENFKEDAEVRSHPEVFTVYLVLIPSKTNQR